jgi:cold shock protein
VFFGHGQDARATQTRKLIGPAQGHCHTCRLKKLAVTYWFCERVFHVRSAEMPQGTIKKLVADRGFGFIAAASGDVFFHHSVVADNKFDALTVGQTVNFEVTTGPDERGRDKGPRAVSVTPA